MEKDATDSVRGKRSRHAICAASRSASCASASASRRLCNDRDGCGPSSTAMVARTWRVTGAVRQRKGAARGWRRGRSPPHARSAISYASTIRLSASTAMVIGDTVPAPGVSAHAPLGDAESKPRLLVHSNEIAGGLIGLASNVRPCSLGASRSTAAYFNQLM